MFEFETKRGHRRRKDQNGENNLRLKQGDQRLWFTELHYEINEKGRRFRLGCRSGRLDEVLYGS